MQELSNLLNKLKTPPSTFVVVNFVALLNAETSPCPSTMNNTPTSRLSLYGLLSGFTLSSRIRCLSRWRQLRLSVYTGTLLYSCSLDLGDLCRRLFSFTPFLFPPLSVFPQMSKPSSSPSASVNSAAIVSLIAPRREALSMVSDPATTLGAPPLVACITACNESREELQVAFQSFVGRRVSGLGLIPKCMRGMPVPRLLLADNADAVEVLPDSETTFSHVNTPVRPDRTSQLQCIVYPPVDHNQNRNK